MCGAGTPLYLRLPDDGSSAPKHVGFLETYVEFVILLCAFVGEGNSISQRSLVQMLKYFPLMRAEAS